MILFLNMLPLALRSILPPIPQWYDFFFSVVCCDVLSFLLLVSVTAIGQSSIETDGAWVYSCKFE